MTEEEELSAAGSAALAAALRRAPAAPEPVVDEAHLVRYLAGALSEDEAEALEGALTRRPAARRALEAVADRLEALGGSREALAARASAGDAVAGEVLALADERMRGALAGDGPGDWEALRGRVDAGARAAWGALQAAIARWSVAPPPSLAVARGPAPGSLLSEATPAGDLRVVAEGLEREAASLVLAGDGESWPLATAPVEAGRAEWLLPGLGAALGLTAGEAAPPGRLRVEGEPVGAPSLWLERPDGAAVSVPVVAGPRIVAGRLSLVLRLPAPVVSAGAGRRLRVGLRLGEGMEAPLGVLPPEAWPAASGDLDLAIELPCPGLPDGALAFPSLLTLRLEA